MRESRVRFIRQQGFATERADEQFYSALMLQPRVIGAIVVLGIVVQSPLLFLVLSAVLWWSALVPTHSPFDAVYNHVVAYRRGLPPLGAAPAPRRFATGMVGAFALAIGVALLAGSTAVAWVLEAMVAVAATAAVFRDSCAGANLYHLLHRRLTAGPSHSSEAVRLPFSWDHSEGEANGWPNRFVQGRRHLQVSRTVCLEEEPGDAAQAPARRSAH